MNINKLHPLTIILIISMILIVPISCDHEKNFKYETIITDIPANLEKLNTEYDDYNSDLPYPARRLHINFSSNQNSSGDNFNILFKYIDISYHQEDDILNFNVTTNTGYSSYENRLLQLVNTDSDEFGPYSFNGSHGWDYFFYANNEGEDFDIKFVYTPRLDWGTYDGQERLYGPYTLTSMNSENDDIYPTLNQDTTKLFFCSNRENSSFDIYSADINHSDLLHEYLTSSNSVQISKNLVLSSLKNDKCPSITKNLLVFTSDREGGYGGFDLYYSLFTYDQWSEPINFGDKINSTSDEYRPITFTFNNFDLMIFSSNRPNGKGGYDLYCVKIEDLISN